MSDAPMVPVSPQILINQQPKDLSNEARVAYLGRELFKQYAPMIQAKDPGELMRLEEGLLSTLRLNPTLHDTVLNDRIGFCGAVLAALRCGLNFDPVFGYAWLVPRKGKVCFQIGYKGLREMALRSGHVKACRVSLVWPDDHFVFEAEPPVLEHRPLMWASGRTYATCLGGYAVVVLADGTEDRLVMSRDEIEKRREVSASKAGPWSTWPEKMAEKTVLAALLRRQRLSVDDRTLLHLDATADRPDDVVPMPRALPRTPGPSMISASVADEIEQPFTVDEPEPTAGPMPYDVASPEVWASYDAAHGKDPAELRKLPEAHARNRAAKLAAIMKRINGADGAPPRRKDLLDRAARAEEGHKMADVEAMRARLRVKDPDALGDAALLGYVAALLRPADEGKK